MEYEYIGAIKIRDGLFLGDQFASQDLEFVVTNKVSRIINCAGKQIPNHWESIGISYLTFPWFDNDTQVIFDQKDEVVNQCYKFIEDGINQGESVIVHSVRGHNRSVCVLCLYFMKKFRWTLYKTLQYLHSRRPDLEIRANFFNQLLALESKFQKQGFGAKTYNWDEIYEESEDKLEEIVLKNTYMNAQAQGVADFKDSDSRPKQNKIKWIDTETKAKLETNSIPPYDQIDFNKRPKPRTAMKSNVKSIVKSADGTKQQQKQDAWDQKEFKDLKDTTLTNESSNQLQSEQNLSQKPLTSLKELKPPVEIRRPVKKDQKEEELQGLKKKIYTQQQLAHQIRLQIDSYNKNQQNQKKNQMIHNLYLAEVYINNLKQYPIAADAKFLATTQQPKTATTSNRKNQFNQTYQPPKVNNFLGSNNENWFKPPPTKGKKQELPPFVQNGRPSTAPNNIQKSNVIPASQFRQNKLQQPTGELIITPYKRQSSLGTRIENNQVPQNQFRPQKQRGFSPQNVYSHNPYAQKQFKPWKKT